MITRTIRDIFTSDIDTIWVDEPSAFEHAQEFLQIVMPRYADRIKLYDEHGAAVPQVRHRGRDRPHPAAERAAAERRLDRHRADRGAGGHRRQQRQLPRRQQRRGDRLPDEPAGGQGDRPAAAAARPGRRHRQRLHRHARREAPPRRRDAPCATPCSRDRARTKILQHLAVRHHRDDPAAHPPVAQAQRLPGLPALPRHRPGQDRARA